MAEIETYVGLDFSPKAVDLAKSLCPQGKYVVGDATVTTLHEDVTYDVVICTEVLEHVPADFSVLNRFRAGTRALCTVPNFPYDSHVRHFETIDDVRERYSQFFDAFDVWPVFRWYAPNHVYYLMDGVRNDRHV